jgi:cellulose synthase/poly-beta-1,6-N-acetylglucosamine synthase-like glycosyltransferase
VPNNLEILSLCIIFLYTFQELFLLFQFKLIPPTANLSNKQFKLSVIISSKNEAENLIKNLPSILTQNHPDYEVIIVDDQSNDDTFQVIQDFQKNHSHLKYFKIDNYKKSSKKNALSCGIRVAKNENLVFTDADCKPKTNQWLSELQGYFGRKDTIILGYSPYSKEKSWLNNLIRFETFQTAVNYFGMAKMGQAYMGVGRNLAYTKTIFNSLGQFNSHQKIASGDDDLFINEASGRFPIHCCINPKTFVESKPKGNWKAWINQKRRHITTASHYKLKHQFWLSFQFVLRFLFWFWVIPVSVMALSLDDYPIIFITLTLLTIKLLVSRITFINLDAKDLWLKSLLLEFHLICLQLYIFSLNLVSPKRNW